jgi:hypothetical protein
MREIKFRAWDAKLKQFHYWGYSDPFGVGMAFTSPPNPAFPSQQYTGLKDANGKEIYEGDIISIDVFTHKSFRSFYPQQDWELGVVKFYHGGFKLAIQSDNGEVYSEIPHDTLNMGNIYENPELIN